MTMPKNNTFNAKEFRKIVQQRKKKLDSVNDIYRGKVAAFFDELEGLVDKLKKQTMALKGTREKKIKWLAKVWADFEEIQTRRFEALVVEYEGAVKKILGTEELDKYWALIKNVEGWLTDFYDTMHIVTLPFVAARQKARMGRGTEIQYAGYDLKKDGTPYKKHLQDYKSMDVPALFPLDDYCFPFKWKKFKFIWKNLDKKYGKGAGQYKYHGTPHGPIHTHNALVYAQRIVNSFRKKKFPGQRRKYAINEHEVYTMVGWHDFWRAVDIDPNVYDIVAEEFYPQELAYAKHAGKKPEDFAYAKGNKKTPKDADLAKLAKDHFNRIEKEIVKDLEVLDEEFDVESLAFVGKEATAALEAWSQVRGIMEKTRVKVKEVKKPTEEQVEQFKKEILSQLEKADQFLQSSLDTDVYKKLNSVAAPFIVDMEDETKLRTFLKTLYDLLDTEKEFILKTTVRPYLNQIKTLVQDINTNVVIARPQTDKELTKIEDAALEKIRTTRNFLKTFKPGIFENVWEKELELLERNILHRRKLNLAGRAHHLRGSGSPYKKAHPSQEESRLSVPLFLDMFGHYFLFLRVMNFIKIHDLKYITPETLEGRIAQDADMLDGIGPEAVERTDDVGLEYGDKYWDEDILLNERKNYIESGGGVKPPDTMTVLLSLCYCWPRCINTGPAEAIIKNEKKVKRMEREIIRYSRVEKGLLSFQIKELQKLMKDFKKASEHWVAEAKKKAPEDAKKLEMTDVYWE